MRAEVIVSKDGQPLVRRALGPGEYLIGRAADCAIRVDSPDVSQRHARLLAKEDGLWLEDLGSSNGRFIEGERVAGSVRLRLPQRVRVGSAVWEINPVVAVEDFGGVRIWRGPGIHTGHAGDAAYRLSRPCSFSIVVLNQPEHEPHLPRQGH